METPKVVQKAPYRCEVESDKAYFWCRCGLSENQPFCDGSHAGTGLTPEKFEASESGAVFFCGCKQTHNSPLCDGTHNSL